ncbi:hypothetical protein AVEN_239687-1 [Araneus ventricosus]|uniref:Uncharacterized protein n=1 Tax=Araneus ventricosus TaxID=182803 RepID=A0A4Y2CS82_ARAVE|nr:hypothetical protein AVEN_239687-1 [Araneus ventricosus]
MLYFTSATYHSNIYLNIWSERRRDQRYFLGKWAKKLTNCEKLPIKNFEAIELDEININKTDRIKDQQYLQDIIRTMRSKSGRKRSWTSQSLPMTDMCKPGLTLVHFPNKP